jgi:hypothetical protein
MSCVVGPAIDSRIKPPDAGIPGLKVKAGQLNTALSAE